jgi:hypothetical protein
MPGGHVWPREDNECCIVAVPQGHTGMDHHDSLQWITIMAPRQPLMDHHYDHQHNLYWTPL